MRTYHTKGILEAGCDEAGRGCLAGPVTAAAVILSPRFRHPLLNDSKLMTEAQRELLRPIIEKKALAWAVAFVAPEEIDRINILQAAIKAMHLAINALQQKPEALLIDGNYFVPYLGISHTCVVKGDSIYKNIAAASVLAKTHRDEYMKQLCSKHPQYGWSSNKGYGTLHHRKTIAAHGMTNHHRHSFNMGIEELEQGLNLAME